MDCYTNVLYLVGEKKQKTYEQNRFTVLKYGYQLEFRIVDYVAKKKKKIIIAKKANTLCKLSVTLYTAPYLKVPSTCPSPPQESIGAIR